MSVSASSSSAKRRSRMPVRSWIHASFVSTNLREVVVRDDPRGGVGAEAGDADPRAGGGADHRSTAKVRVARAASWPSTFARRLAPPIGPRTWSISHVERRGRRPGATMRLKRQSSMPAKKAILPAVLLEHERGDGAGLRHRLDDQDTGHHGPLGEVAGEPPAVLGHAIARDDARAGLELDDLVEEQERRAVREDRLDHLPPERGGGDHAAVSAAAEVASAASECTSRV